MMNNQNKDNSKEIAKLENLIDSQQGIINSLKAILAELKGSNLTRYDRRADNNGRYYFIDTNDYGGFDVIYKNDAKTPYDEARFEKGNYFLSELNATRAAQRFNNILLFETLVQKYCPNFIPDWNDENQDKYFVGYDYSTLTWGYFQRLFCPSMRVPGDICFPTKEIAEQVVQELNAGTPNLFNTVLNNVGKGGNNNGL